MPVRTSARLLEPPRSRCWRFRTTRRGRRVPSIQKIRYAPTFRRPRRPFPSPLVHGLRFPALGTGADPSERKIMPRQRQTTGGLPPVLDARANAAVRGGVRPARRAELLPLVEAVSLTSRVLPETPGREGCEKDPEETPCVVSVVGPHPWVAQGLIDAPLPRDGKAGGSAARLLPGSCRSAACQQVADSNNTGSSQQAGSKTAASGQQVHSKRTATNPPHPRRSMGPNGRGIAALDLSFTLKRPELVRLSKVISTLSAGDFARDGPEATWRNCDRWQVRREGG